MSLNDVLDDLTRYLEFEISGGNREAGVSRATLQALGRAPVPRGAAAAAGTGADTPGDLDTVAREVARCTQCSLRETRANTVPGQGALHPDIMFIGEAPGADEDRQGLAFVGRAGKLLTKMIEAMGFTRDEVFIGNILKCRPPGNRAPLPGEMETCMPYLKRQIAALRPKVIIALGATAVKGLLDTTTGITKLRGQWRLFEGIDLMPTYHPAYLLRNPSAKHEAWDDLQAVLERLGRPIPGKSQKSKNQPIEN